MMMDHSQFYHPELQRQFEADATANLDVKYNWGAADEEALGFVAATEGRDAAPRAAYNCVPLWNAKPCKTQKQPNSL